MSGKQTYSGQSKVFYIPFSSYLYLFIFLKNMLFTGIQKCHHLSFAHGVDKLISINLGIADLKRKEKKSQNLFF